jgi:hypothetical protein
MEDLPIEIVHKINSYVKTNIIYTLSKTMASKKLDNDAIYLSSELIGNENKIKNLIIDSQINLPSDSFQYIKHLSIHDNFQFPNNILKLETLDLYKSTYTANLIEAFNGVKKLRLPEKFNENINLENFKNLQLLDMGKYFNSEAKFPTNLKILILSNLFNQELDVEDIKLDYLDMGLSFNNVFHFPNTLKVLKFSYSFNQPLDFIEELIELKTIYLAGNYDDQITFDLPDSVNVIFVEYNSKMTPVQSPNSNLQIVYTENEYAIDINCDYEIQYIDFAKDLNHQNKYCFYEFHFDKIL